MAFSPEALLERACPVVILSEAKNLALQKPGFFVAGALQNEQNGLFTKVLIVTGKYRQQFLFVTILQ
jgi:hypothetical protein